MQNHAPVSLAHCFFDSAFGSIDVPCLGSPIRLFDAFQISQSTKTVLDAETRTGKPYGIPPLYSSTAMMDREMSAHVPPLQVSCALPLETQNADFSACLPTNLSAIMARTCRKLCCSSTAGVLDASTAFCQVIHLRITCRPWVYLQMLLILVNSGESRSDFVSCFDTDTVRFFGFIRLGLGRRAAAIVALSRFGAEST